ncbi:MAG: hypothetical protein ACR2OV_15835 [Hyphomicrobiaceae bacterium]
MAEQADGQATPAPEAGGAPEKSVDDLLKEFDTKTTPEPKSEPKSEESDDRLNQVLDYVERKAKEEGLEQVNKDIAESVKTAVGDSDLDPEYVEGKLHFKANTDPKFARAWMSRHENPDQWNRLARQFGKELAGNAKSSVDQSVSDDRAAVAAAVRSQNTKPAEAAPSNKDIHRMSDAEFNRMKRDLSGR